MIPILFVDPPSSTTYAELVLDRCSVVVAPEQCTVAATSEAPVGIVTWRSPTTVSVRVEVPPQMGERTLEFQLEDQLEVRAKAIGLILGALLLELGGGPPKQSRVELAAEPESGPSPARRTRPRGNEPDPTVIQQTQRSPTDPAVPRTIDPLTARQRPHLQSTPSRALSAPTVRDRDPSQEPDLRWAVGAGGFAGPGLDPGPWRFGASVQGGLMIHERLGVGSAATVSASPEWHGLRNRWLTVSIGPRFEPELAEHWDLLLHAGLALERWTTRLDARGSEPPEAAHRAYLGFRGGAGVGVRSSDIIRISLGISVATTPGSAVRVASDTQATNPTIGLAVQSAAEIGVF